MPRKLQLPSNKRFEKRLSPDDAQIFGLMNGPQQHQFKLDYLQTRHHVNGIDKTQKNLSAKLQKHVEKGKAVKVRQLAGNVPEKCHEQLSVSCVPLKYSEQPGEEHIVRIQPRGSVPRD